MLPFSLIRGYWVVNRSSWSVTAGVPFNALDQMTRVSLYSYALKCMTRARLGI